MRKIENFQDEKVKLENIWGGGIVETSSSEKDPNGCTVTTTDSFDDKDGDGLWGNKESGKVCQKTVCS